MLGNVKIGDTVEVIAKPGWNGTQYKVENITPSKTTPGRTLYIGTVIVSSGRSSVGAQVKMWGIRIRKIKESSKIHPAKTVKIFAEKGWGP